MGDLNGTSLVDLSMIVASDQMLGALLVLLVCITGSIFNMKAFLRLKTQQINAPHFAGYARAHVLFDTFNLVSFLLHMPWSLLFPEYWALVDNATNIPFGYFALATEFCAFLSSMFLTINRAASLLAINKGSKVSFSPLWIIVPSFVFLYLVSIAFLFPGCNFTFDRVEMQWYFSKTPCGNFISFYIDFMFICSFFTVEVLIDFCVLIVFSIRTRSWQMVGDRSKKWTKQGAIAGNNTVRELRMFAQSSLASLGFVYMLVSFQFFTGMTDSRFWKFVHTTLAWEVSHCVQGITIITLDSTSKSTRGRKTTIGEAGKSILITTTTGRIR